MTILDFLSKELPYEYVRAIRRNVYYSETLFEESSGMISEDLFSLFEWDESNEGPEFWEEVTRALLEETELPRLPFTAEWFPNTYVCTELGSFLINFNGSHNDIQIEIELIEEPTTESVRFIYEQHCAFLN